MNHGRISVASFKNGINAVCAFATVIVLFCGVVNYYIVSRFGGEVYIAMGILLLMGMVFTRTHLQSEDNSYLWKSILLLLFFCVMYVLGLEIFHITDDVKNFLGYEADLRSFNIMKSLPLWIVGGFIVIDMDEYQHRKMFWLLVVLLIWGMLATLWALNELPEFVRYKVK